MNGRKASDADIQRVLNSFTYPNQEPTFRQMAQGWGLADIYYAMDRLPIDNRGPHQDFFRALLGKLREEREAADARAASQAATANRHEPLMQKLDESLSKVSMTTLDVLELIAETSDGYSNTVSKKQFSLFKELAASHYIVGQIGPDAHDSPETMVENVTLTTEGRQLMERLQKETLTPRAPLPRPALVVQSTMNPKAVFIVHGHDKENLRRLRILLRRRYDLDPVVLSTRPGKGRTIIEKFEAEAKTAAFAFVIFTPDDVVRKGKLKYGQARPNVIFELGWFYGRLSRDKVCILFKKGARIHSDLNGISRIEFARSINEKTKEIENELLSGGLLVRGAPDNIRPADAHPEKLQVSSPKLAQVAFPNGETEAGITSLLKILVRADRQEEVEDNLPGAIDQSRTMTDQFVKFGLKERLFERQQVQMQHGIKLTSFGRQFAADNHIQ